MKVKSTSYIILFVIAVIIINVAQGGCMQIKKEDAIKIAKKEAISMGYNVDSMKIKAIKYTTPWNEYILKDSNSEYDTERKNKLINKEYWAVYYEPIPKNLGEIIVGGRVCIFVDSNNGEIITNVRWK